MLPDEETEFWQAVSQSSLDKIWDNTEDDVYESLMSEEERARKIDEISESLIESRKRVYEELAKGKE